MKRRRKWTGLALGIVSLLQINLLPVQAEEYWPEGPQIEGESAIVMEASTGTVLYEKNSHEQSYPASITKIMTALLAVENSNLDEEVVFSKNAVYKTEGSGISRDVDEVMSMEECLYGLMLASANECGYAIAEHVGGSVEGFAEMMNAKARDIGCFNTYYITPNGLDATDEDGTHSTTAADLARTMRYCITQSPKREEFLTITRTSSYSFGDTEGLRSFTVGNKNAFLTMMEGALSGKTGFTNNAGYCYVGALKREDRTFIVALLGCGWPNNRSYKWSDTRKLMSYGLEHYEYRDIWEEPVLGTLPVKGGIPESGRLEDIAYAHLELAAGAESSGRKLLLSEQEQITIETNLPEDLSAPVEPDTIVGSIRYYLNGDIVRIHPITTPDKIDPITLPWCLKKIVTAYQL